MNKFVLISISLLIFIIGAGCACAASLDVNDASLSSGLGGGGDNGPFYAANVSPQYLGNVSPQYLAEERPQCDSLGSDHNERHQRGIVDSTLLSSGIGGGGDDRPFYAAKLTYKKPQSEIFSSSDRRERHQRG